jgi:hypothetical protein
MKTQSFEFSLKNSTRFLHPVAILIAQRSNLGNRDSLKTVSELLVARKCPGSSLLQSSPTLYWRGKSMKPKQAKRTKTRI